MFCKKCGEKIHDEAVICPKCGCMTDNYIQKDVGKSANSLNISRIKIFEILLVVAIFICLFLPFYGNGLFSHSIAEMPDGFLICGVPLILIGLLVCFDKKIGAIILHTIYVILIIIIEVGFVRDEFNEYCWALVAFYLIPSLSVVLLFVLIYSTVNNYTKSASKNINYAPINNYAQNNGIPAQTIGSKNADNNQITPIIRYEVSANETPLQGEGILSAKQKKPKTLHVVICTFVISVVVGVIAWLVTGIEPEKNKVASDTQLCKSVKTAMEVANTDAKIAGEFKPFKKGDVGDLVDIEDCAGDFYLSSVKETLGVDNLGEVDKQIESKLGKKTGKISYVWVLDDSVVVYIDNTDKNGGTEKGYPLTNTDCKCIYAGPVELVPDNINQTNSKQGSKHKNQTNKSSSEKKKENVTKPSTPIIDPDFYATVSNLGQINGVNVSWTTVPGADGYEYSWNGWEFGDEVKHAGAYSGNMEYTTNTEAELYLGYNYGGFSIVVRSYKLDGDNKIFSDWSDELFWNYTDDSYENQTDDLADVDLFSIQGTEYYCVDNPALVLSINDEGNEAYISDVDCGSCEGGGPLSYISPGQFHVTEYDEPGQYSGDATIYFYEDEYGWDVFYCTDYGVIYEFR